jgi:hypothetical protein
VPNFHASYQRFEGTLLPSLVVDKNRKQISKDNQSTTFPNFSCELATPSGISAATLRPDCYGIPTVYTIKKGGYDWIGLQCLFFAAVRPGRSINGEEAR